MTIVVVVLMMVMIILIIVMTNMPPALLVIDALPSWQQDQSVSHNICINISHVYTCISKVLNKGFVTPVDMSETFNLPFKISTIAIALIPEILL